MEASGPRMLLASAVQSQRLLRTGACPGWCWQSPHVCGWQLLQCKLSLLGLVPTGAHALKIQDACCRFVAPAGSSAPTSRIDRSLLPLRCAALDWLLKRLEGKAAAVKGALAAGDAATLATALLPVGLLLLVAAGIAVASRRKAKAD